MLTKEDYMKLDKERLAELLVEKDNEIERLRQYYPPVISPYLQPDLTPKCYAGGICTNPHMDCINCPRKITGSPWTITTSNIIRDNNEQDKDDEKSI